MIECVECGPDTSVARSDAWRKGFNSDVDSDDKRNTVVRFELFEFSIGEFDPGSGRTLAACLTHASRTGLGGNSRFSGRRVRNT
jgi:hypothetical protein